jgi:hypothetical protein
LEDLNKELKELLSNMKMSDSKQDELLADDFSRNYRKEIDNFISILHNNTFEIDEMNAEFRSTFKEWTGLLKELTVTYNVIKSVARNTSVVDIALNVSSQIEKKQSLGSIDSTTYFSKENSSNINISIFYTFFYMLAFSIILPSNVFYMNKLNEDMTVSGLVLACTPLGAFLSTYFVTKLLDKTYKVAMIISISFVFLGYGLYILADFVDMVILACVGRFILGLGSGRLINRNYLLAYVPKSKLSKYLLYFQISSLFGLAIGPLINILLRFLNSLIFNSDDKIFNNYMNPAWFTLLIAFILLIIVYFIYTETTSTNFSILKIDIDDDKNTCKTISDGEQKMLETLDSRLGLINQQNNFSDTNLVSKNIDQIAWREKKTKSYLYKCFIVFATILFVIRVMLFNIDDK